MYLITPKDFVTITAILFFSSSAFLSKQFLPLLCVYNSIKHHKIYPDCAICYYIDMIFNIISSICASIYYIKSNPYILLFCCISFYGWNVGQIIGGYTTWKGAIIHSFFCQLPASYGVYLFYNT